MPLFARDKEALRTLVEAAKRNETATFDYFQNMQGSSVQFDKPGGGVESIEMPRRELSVLLQSGEYVQLLSRVSAMLTDAAFAEVDRDFAPQSPLVHIPPVVNIVNNYGTMSGGTIAQGKTVSVDGDKFTHIINTLAQSLPSVPESSRPEVAEHLQSIAGEVATGEPKQSRIKAYIGAILQHGANVATMVGGLVQLADAVGLGGWIKTALASFGLSA